MKTKHCDKCKHYTNNENEVCELEYKPRFYVPRNSPYSDFGYKKKCKDFEELK